MKYRVVLHRLALEDLENAYEWVARNAPVTAAKWLDRFQDALLTLESFPQRQPLARENRKVDVELREFLFGSLAFFALSSQSMETPSGFSAFADRNGFL